MKKIYALAIAFATVFIACNNNKNSSAPTSASTSAKEKKISKRDYSITKENAYNDLFLDSADVENYLLKNNIADSTSTRSKP